MSKWQKKIDVLNIAQPFTKDEKASYQKRDMDFIRSIQVTKNLSKNEAKEEFMKYLQSEPKSKLKLRNSIRKLQKQYTQYPKTHVPEPVTGKQHIRPKPKEKKGAKTVKEAITKTKSAKVRQRLISASKKYPSASVFELRHGINSKASQEWRLRHGQGRYFEK